MGEKIDNDKVDDVMLPGFRFHPTDEELVGFYLKRKIQHRTLPIELIKQVDIYKYDPWDLPKLATTGEKEWYFYCPRDRKYRNSARPNRVTGAGFWKATGTDRPIYSSDGGKCIGLKKSLVFYRGRAAKGIKTDWMMHEFRLPSLTDHSSSPKKIMDKNIPANDSWAICRIFKKTNSIAQRALSHSLVSPLVEYTASDVLTQEKYTTQTASGIQLCSNYDLQQASNTTFSTLNIPSFKPINQTLAKPYLLTDPHTGFMFSPQEISGLLNLNPTLPCDVTKTIDSIDFGGSQENFSSFSMSMPQDIEANMNLGEAEMDLRKNLNSDYVNNQWGNLKSIGFPFSLPPNMPWDSPPCPSDMSTGFSSNKCYT